MTAQDALLRIRRLLGPAGWLAADGAPAYLEEQRGAYRSEPLLIARPASVVEVARLVEICRKANLAMVPQSGNTGLCGGAVAQAGQVLVSLDRLTALREVDPVNRTLTAEAGCILAHLQQAAADADCYLPLSFASEGSARLGGVLSTNAGGVNVLRYGNARALTLGIEAVLPSGEIYRGLSGLRKDNTGYDLRDLLIGAEGTLGIITAATLRLHAPVVQRATAWIGLATPEQALVLLHQAQALSGEAVIACELLSRQAVALVLAHIAQSRDPLGNPCPWYLLLELGSSRPGNDLTETLQGLLEGAAGKGALLDAALPRSLAQRAAIWRLRESVPEAQRHAGASIKHDVAVPVSRVPELLSRGVAMAADLLPGVRPCPFGHLGDGNLHFNFTRPEAMTDEAFLALRPDFNAHLHDLVVQMGGSISAEHGIGLLKVAELARYKDPVALSAMRAIKGALDPQWLMNPGKVLRAERP